MTIFSCTSCLLVLVNVLLMQTAEVLQQQIWATSIFKRDFFFFPKKGSSHSDRSDCSRSSAHRCFKAPAMPQTMHATLFVFTSTLRNTEPISAAMKGKKKKSSGDQNTHSVWEGSNTLISVYYKQELHPHPSTSPQGDEFSPAVMSCQVADFFLISPCWKSYSSVCTQG